jgi:predicted outer membrane protein
MMRKPMISAAAYMLVACFVLAASAAQAQSAQDFANKVALSDMFEIQSSQLALTKQPDAIRSLLQRR